MKTQTAAILVVAVVLCNIGATCAAGRTLTHKRALTQNATAIANLEQSFAEDKREDGRAAKAFCASPAFKNLQCGFASEAEVAATIKRQCPLCGTLYRGVPSQLPAEVEGVDRYNQWAVDLVSLACKGPVVVRSVFKMLQEPQDNLPAGLAGTNCTNSKMVLVDDDLLAKGGKASPVVRCELELPAGPGSEEQRALRAKEGRCWTCGLCSDGQGCPSGVGKWYSDSYTTVARGCDIDAQKGYEYYRAGININPRTKILLAKFEVCNSPGCFDAAYEQVKQKAAKVCVKGKCA